MENIKKTILVVDDEQVILDILKRRFERMGFVVITAASGTLGIELIKTTPLDLVVCDVKMPNGVTGMSVLSAVKRYQPQNSLLWPLLDICSPTLPWKKSSMAVHRCS